MKYEEWTKIPWPFNTTLDIPTYVKSFGIGKVYIQDSTEWSYMYTIDFGDNSERSYTGCFFECNVHSVQEAMEILDHNRQNILRGHNVTKPK